jgi:hypothetical protein
MKHMKKAAIAGRWYCFGAEQKTVQEGSFRVAFAQWQEGE